MKAFPSTLEYIPEDRAYEQEDGMDLRDYFAASAMQSLILEDLRSQQEKHDLSRSEAVSFFAYKIADAMMEAREK